MGTPARTAISDSNRSAFESLTDGQISRILTSSPGTNLEGVTVSVDLLKQLNQFQLDKTAKPTGDGFMSNEFGRFEVTMNAGPMDGESPNGKTQRWPVDQIQKETDYVFFQFGKYIPPFGEDAGNYMGAQREEGSTDRDGNVVDKYKGAGAKRRGYNASAALLKPDPTLPGIMLPIPQDLSNTTAAGWQGKSFTGLGRAAVAAAGGGSLNFAQQKAGDWTGNISALQNSLTTQVLNLVPGVGGNLDVNDISGSTQGIVLNPNAELLYDSPELREIGMSFKMVPRNPNEASVIRNICNTFRKAALPSWGKEGEDDFSFRNRVSYEKGSGEGTKQGASGRGGKGEIKGENFIRVPSLCKFTFMKGNAPHGWLAQFKPCAISNVVVNYTPDNTYATYSDGSPVATEIRLNFQETKLIFRDEVDKGF